MSLMKAIAVDIAEGVCHTRTEENGQTSYSYDTILWYYDPAKAWHHRPQALSDSNPNNCNTCMHRLVQINKREGDLGWCAMYRHEPTTMCTKHTGVEARRYNQVFLDQCAEQFDKLTSEG